MPTLKPMGNSVGTVVSEEFAEQMELAREFMQENREALRELAK